MESELANERKRTLELKQECDALKSDKGVVDLENELLQLQHENTQLQQKTAQQTTQLTQSEAELHKVCKALGEAKSEQTKFIDVALVSERKLIKELKETIAKKDQELGELRAQNHTTEEDKADVDKQLEEALYWKSEYEKQYGLTESVLYQKKLKNGLKRREKEIERLNSELCVVLGVLEKKEETCRMLKKDAKDTDFTEIQVEEVSCCIVLYFLKEVRRVCKHVFQDYLH